MNVCSVRDGLLGELNNQQQKALESTVRSLDYLTATVKKFLNLGKIEKGELEPKKATVAIKNEVIDVVVDSSAVIAGRKNMTIKNLIDENLKVNADPELMQIVVNNLVTNAIKYGTENSEIILTSRNGHGNSFVEIEVYNDSTPISQQEKEKLFQRFSRLDNAATREVKGTGLGLFITKQIIGKHGGDIWVEPREHGNSFIFRIDKG
jgi:signal transduction histidine kinase